MQGTLVEGVLPEVLRDLYVGRRSGTLLLRKGPVRRTLVFRRGQVIFADSSEDEEALPRVLLDRGFLPAEAVERAEEASVLHETRFGIALLELGLLDREKLQDAVAAQLQKVLDAVLAWNGASYVFREDASESPIDEDVTLKLPTGELILECVRRIRDPEVVRRGLGALDRVLRPSSDPMLRFQNITLTPTDGYVVSRVDGTLTAREVLQVIPLPPEDVERSLFGLLCTGMIEATDEVRGPARPAAEPARPAAPVAPAEPPRPAPPPAAPPPSASVVPPVRATPAAGIPPVKPPARAAAPQPPPKPASPPRPSPEEIAQSEREARRREIVDLYTQLGARTHFEVLGLVPGATDAEVKDAYFRLARKYHPDALRDLTAELGKQIDAIFIRVGQAYDVLRNPRSRASYEAQLPRPAAVSSAAGRPSPAPSQPSVPVEDPEVVARRVADAIRQADRLFLQEKYWDAIQLVQPVLGVADARWRTRGRLILARCYLKNPKWKKRAEEALQDILREDQKQAEAFYLLGTIYKDEGIKTRALGFFRQALQVNPEFKEAREELAALEPAPVEPAPEPSGGLLKKLFRR